MVRHAAGTRPLTDSQSICNHPMLLRHEVKLGVGTSSRCAFPESMAVRGKAFTVVLRREDGYCWSHIRHYMDAEHRGRIQGFHKLELVSRC